MAGTGMRRVSMRGTAILVIGFALLAGATGGIAHATGSVGETGGAVGLTDPTAGHPYRHGAVPRIVGVSKPSSSASQPTAPQGGFFRGQGHPLKGHMSFGGGYPPLGGVGVVASQPKVYLVLWGSQWGTQSASGGYQVFSGDPMGIAPLLQAFFSGLGTNQELWSAVATQYCQGIARGAISCPISAAHVGFPSGGVLAGVWEDTSFTPPTGPPGSRATPAITGLQIAQEAANAATFFGDSSPAAQYVVMAPTGTNPDNWVDPKNGFCAYHGNTGGNWPSQGLTGPDVAYTNMPYVTDSTCWQGTVNNPGLLDGVTIVEGHEYYETLTDPFPTSGWTDAKGREIGDKCIGLNRGLPGAAINLTLATGSFAVQGMWSNDLKKGKGDCAVAHTPILTANPGKQTTKAGTPVSLAINAIDVIPGRTLTYSATGLPAGLSINSSSGLVSGTPGIRGRSHATVTASDSSNSFSVSFKWTVKR
jgi:hypothetical protein